MIIGKINSRQYFDFFYQLGFHQYLQLTVVDIESVLHGLQFFVHFDHKHKF